MTPIRTHDAREPADSTATPHTTLAPGDIVGGRYRIEHVIGTGGNGAVLRAVHLGLDLPVAIKVLFLAARPAEQVAHHSARFAREARTTAGLRHRNVLSVHDAGELDDGSPYLVMELIEGEDLAQRIARGPIAIAAIVDLGRQLFSGLTALADAGVLHRDVKPANLMLRREADGQVVLKLVDFGIAKVSAGEPRLTVTGVIIGTPHYMSPEQLRGEELDVRSDLYAGCAVLYEAMTGRAPFDGVSAPLVIGQIFAGHLVPIRTLRPDCPEALARLVERGLSRDRDARPAHPLEVVTALEQQVAGPPGLPIGAHAWEGETAPDGAAIHPRAPTPTRERRLTSEPHRDDRASRPGGARPVAFLRGLGPDAATLGSRTSFVGGAIAIAAVLALGAGLVAARPTLPTATEVAVSLAVPVAAAAPAPAPSEPVDALLDRGFEALARGEIDVALGHYRAAVVAEPARVEATRGRGLAAASAGLDDEAISAFERYLALAPDAPDAERVRDHLEMARAHRREHLVTAAPKR